MKKNVCFILIVITAVIFMGGCFSDFLPDGGKGTFTISLGGNGARSVSTTGTSLDLDKVTYTVELTGSGQYQSHPNIPAKGKDQTFTVEAGDWTIYIEVFTNNSGVAYPCASGKKLVTIDPGHNGAITIEINSVFLVNSNNIGKVGLGIENNDPQYNDWTPDAHYLLIDVINNPSISPIGTNTEPFTGTFDGGGYTIKELTISDNDKSNQGLIGYLGPGGVVKNVNLEDVNITLTGSDNSYSSHGGIVGCNNGGRVENCSVSGLSTISGTHRGGGIVGRNINGGIVQNCYVTANVSGVTFVGGIVGANGSGAIVRYCYATGNVTATGGVSGGIAGSNNEDSGNGIINNCVALNTTVTGNTPGRIVMHNPGTLANNYARGDMKIGANTSSATEVNTGIGADTQQGADITYYEWNSAAWWRSIGFTDRWWEDKLPTSVLATPGSRALPFEVTNLTDLGKVGSGDSHTGGTWTLSAHYKQTENIGTSGTVFTHTRIGSTSTLFTGTYDGNGKTITGLKIDASDNQGMFGGIGPSGVVKNVRLVNASIKGGLYTGGIAGYNSGGTIQNCSVSGNSSVTGTSNYTGGIVGYSVKNGSNNAIISNCYNTGSVSGTGDNVGGILGQNADGTVQYCYNTGEVLCGGGSAGGVVGFNSGSTLRQYCVALNASITRTNGSSEYYGRITGATGGTALSNYARNDMVFYANPTAPASTFPGFNVNGKDGNNIPIGITQLSTVFTSNWDPDVWDIPADGAFTLGGNLPRLKVFGASLADNPYPILPHLDGSD
jgi:hypothetical protein